jgi:Ca-activated chloride channel family protein
MSGLSLLAPAGLIALIGVPLIVLFHMRHTTPLVQNVPSLRFWRLAQLEESEREKFRRPPLTIFLLLHILLVALIGVALARPATSRALGGLGSRTEPTHLILLIDGSTSMSAQTPSGQTRFAAALVAADKRLADLHQGDVATIVLMATHSSTLEATDPASLRAVRERLAATRLPGGIADLNASLQLASDLLLPSMTDRIVVITDGALPVDPSIVQSVNATIELQTVGGGPTDNLAITDLTTRASAKNPGQQQLYARVLNFGANPVTAPIVVTADGIQVSKADFTVAAGKSNEIVQDLPAGAKAVSISYNTPDALPADNTASSVLLQQSDFGLRILLATDVPDELLRALTVLPGAAVTTMTPAEAAATKTSGVYDLVVYEHATPKGRLPDTPVLIVDPDQGGLLPTNGVMANPTVQTVRAQDPLLSGVELAGATFGQTPVLTLDATATEIVGGDAGPLIYRDTVPGGTEPMIVLAFDVSASNLPRRVAFPILIANIANELVPSPLPAAVAIGDPVIYRPRTDAASIRVTSPDGTSQDFPLSKPSDQADGAVDTLRDIAIADTGQPGTYTVAEIAADGTATGGGSFVVNAGQPSESNLTPNDQLASALALAHASGDAGATRDLSDIWPALALAALTLLLVEWLLTLLPRRRARRLRRGTPVPRLEVHP